MNQSILKFALALSHDVLCFWILGLFLFFFPFVLFVHLFLVNFVVGLVEPDEKWIDLIVMIHGFVLF